MSPSRSRTGLLGAFSRSRRGNVATLFGLALLPTTGLVGAAVDYSRASSLHRRLQSATDLSVLALCQMDRTSTTAQLSDAAQAMLTSVMPDRTVQVAITAKTSPREIRLDTNAAYQSVVMKIMSANLASMPVSASATCFNEQQTFEIALVLDNTLSMLNSGGGQTKMQALKTAATDFVNFIYDNPMMAPATKMSLVPFAASVAVAPATYRTASWVDTAGGAASHWSFLQGGATAASGLGSTIKNRFDLFDRLKGSVPSWTWGGCFEAPPYPLNVQDVAPVSSNKDSYYVPLFAPDESGDGGAFYHQNGSATVVSANSYLNDHGPSCSAVTDEATRTGRVCKYVAVANPKTTNGVTTTGPNAACTSRPLTRLTTSRTTLVSEIAAMVADGTTNIHEGFMWGWRTVSPNSVFADGVSYSQPLNNKVVILMTDGMNTWLSNAYNPILKSTYSAYGYVSNPDGTTAAGSGRLASSTAPTTDAQARAAIDALTLAACQNARNAGVRIYTIGFSVSSDPIDQQGIDMLKACAGSPGQAFVANDATSIVAAFQEIAQGLSKLRLTH